MLPDASTTAYSSPICPLPAYNAYTALLFAHFQLIIHPDVSTIAYSSPICPLPAYNAS